MQKETLLKYSLQNDKGDSVDRIPCSYKFIDQLTSEINKKLKEDEYLLSKEKGRKKTGEIKRIISKLTSTIKSEVPWLIHSQITDSLDKKIKDFTVFEEGINEVDSIEIIFKDKKRIFAKKVDLFKNTFVDKQGVESVLFLGSYSDDNKVEITTEKSTKNVNSRMKKVLKFKEDEKEIWGNEESLFISYVKNASSSDLGIITLYLLDIYFYIHAKENEYKDYVFTVEKEYEDEESFLERKESLPEEKEDSFKIILHEEKGFKSKHNNISLNQLIMSDPSSGKTHSIKKLIRDKGFEVAYQNPKSDIESKQHLLIQNISNEYLIGTKLTSIATATIFQEKEFYLYADEVGRFNLDKTWGVLKKVLKSTQRVKRKTIKNTLEDLGIETKEHLTFEDYVSIGEEIEKREPEKITWFTEGKYRVPLWIPENLSIIMLSNYEDEIMDKISSSEKGWNDKGGRFNVSHYYLANEENQKKYNLKTLFLEDSKKDHAERITAISSFNDNLLAELENTANKEITLKGLVTIKKDMVFQKLLTPTFTSYFNEDNKELDYDEIKLDLGLKMEDIMFEEESDKDSILNVISSIGRKIR